MERSIIFNSIFMFIFIWGIALFFLWFRPKLEFFWKIMATLVYAFYLWFFWEEVFRGYQAIRNAWYPVVLSFGKELILLVFYCTFIFWPITLIRAFYKSDEIGAEKLVRFMCILTPIVWLAIAIYVFNNKGIDEFFFRRLVESIPFLKK